MTSTAGDPTTVTGNRTAGSPAHHIAEVDQLKGLAILFVICIHAEVLRGTAVFDHLVNRAVYIFIVLFGITGELWFAGKDDQRSRLTASIWLRSRFTRLLLGFWTVSALWWLVYETTGAPFDWARFLFTFGGYAPWIGTTWFVTLILQLVLLFPFVRWLSRLFLPAALLSLLLTITVLCVWHLYEIRDFAANTFTGLVSPDDFYAFWIFSPRVLYHVLGGMLVARYWKARIPRWALVGCSTLVLGGAAVAEITYQLPSDQFVGSLRRMSINYSLDLPLTVALLGVAEWVRLPRRVGQALTWCGRHSYGLYLGHVLVHESLLLYDVPIPPKSHFLRFAYAGSLIAGGAALTLLGNTTIVGLRSRLSTLRRKAGGSSIAEHRPLTSGREAR